MNKKTFKFYYPYALSAASFIIGTVITFIGLFATNLGLSDGSILGLVGEFLTLAGAGAGLGAYVKHTATETAKEVIERLNN